MLVVITLTGPVELSENPPQRGLPKPPHCTRSQPQPVIAPRQITLLLQLPFQITERLEVAHGLPAQMLGEQVDINIVQRRNLVTLGQLRLKLLKIS
jgi:hypothetical protein